MSWRTHQSSGRRGTTSVVALVTITSLTFVAGSFIVRITNRSREAFHSASWVEAGQAAESGAAFALAELRRTVPTSLRYPSDAWTGWTAVDGNGNAISVPLSRDFPANSVVTRKGLSLTHLGEGNTTVTAEASVDAPFSLVDSSGRQWFRIRAKGSASLPGAARASLSAVDRDLRRFAFVRDWTTGARVTTPQVTRTVEWIAEPVPPFPAALQAGNLVSTSNGTTTVDSYDSTSSAKSTSGEYDSAKKQRNGDVLTNYNSFSLAGSVAGSVGTNGVQPSANLAITGTTDTSHFGWLAPVNAPDWGVANFISWPVYFPTQADSGPASKPARYHVSAIYSNLTLNAIKDSTGVVVPSKVEVWVDGDISASLIVENGVQATFYVGGDIDLKGSDLSNASHQSANFQIYGLQPPANTSHTIQVNMNADVYAAIYAPGHDVVISGSTGDWMGALTAQSIKLKGNRKIHYDESLAKRAALLVDYRMASWIEDVRP